MSKQEFTAWFIVGVVLVILSFAVADYIHFETLVRRDVDGVLDLDIDGNVELNDDEWLDVGGWYTISFGDCSVKIYSGDAQTIEVECLDDFIVTDRDGVMQEIPGPITITRLQHE